MQHGTGSWSGGQRSARRQAQLGLGAGQLGVDHLGLGAAQQCPRLRHGLEAGGAQLVALLGLAHALGHDREQGGGGLQLCKRVVAVERSALALVAPLSALRLELGGERVGPRAGRVGRGVAAAPVE
jgi:hypothetical protein